MTDLALKALAFAEKAHAGQTRKYTGEPYLNHLIAVHDLVDKYTIASPTERAIALLHDTVEDTPVTYSDISAEFGTEVAIGVFWLTDVEKELGNRKTRKEMDRKRLAVAPTNIQNIKLCDLIDNSSTIMQHDPAFAERYLGEKYQLLMVMRGGLHLWNRAMQIIKDSGVMQNPDWVKAYT